jgi:hypothetical protein
MNPLESLKERLKQKPVVQSNKGVKVILAPPTEENVTIIQEKTRPIIIAEKDDGARAKDILERIKEKKLSTVVKKFPEERKEPMVSKAPIIEEDKFKKPKKLSKETIILEEEVEKPVVEELPQGGPRLEEFIQPAPIQPVAFEQGEPVEEIILETQKPKKRTTKRVKKDVIPLGTDMAIQIGDTPLPRRLPPLPIFDVNVSSYYMNNREIFVNFINGLFEPYKEDLLDESKGISCEDIGKDTGELSLLTHQRIVRDYINLYSPYRGLLLYHGLGSGKTCTSIAIAEGMKSGRKVIIMTPASLRRNYIEEIKKCGDLLYRKNQFWEWISTDDDNKLVDPLAISLGLPKTYITRNHGAWLVNITKPSNYNELTASDKKRLNDQLDEMIRNKYTFYNYNGLTRKRFAELTNNFETNIFDNAVVIIDEAHNFISRIVNKINKISKFSEKKRGPEALLPQSLALVFYEFLLRADNCRVVLLTGTPIINYPNEIGILFNILRGYIKTWNFTLDSSVARLSKDTLLDIFSKEKILDYVDYVPSSKTLVITRNPYGFENKITSSSGYKGVTNEKKEKRNDAGDIERDEKGGIIYEERGTMSDAEFIKRITKILKKNDITAVSKGTNFTVNTALPDTLDEFINTFINKDTGNITNVDKFKRRIMGLTSYFRSAQEELLPAYDKDFDRHIVYIPMSDYQFQIYETYRQDERVSEKPSKSGTIDKDGIFKEPSSTYRIFSRLACNFVMPKPPGRPNPAEYRALADSKKKDKLFIWMKEKYFKNTDEYDSDIQQKLDAFKILVEPVYFENELFYNNILKSTLDGYLNLYFTKNYREPMEVYFRKNAPVVFRKHMSNEELQLVAKEFQQKEVPQEEVPQKEIQLVIAEEKVDAKKKEKEKQREDKERQKAEEKASKERQKAEEKASKEQQKAEEKAAKERQKAEEKAAKEQQKAEEKAAKERQKAEEKERKRIEKIKKGGNPDDDSDDDDSHDDALEGGETSPKIEESGNLINPAEKFIDEQEEGSELSIRLQDYKDDDAILREADELEGDEILETMGSVEYKEAIKQSLNYLKLRSQEFLTPEALKIYSPKFLAMLENIEDTEHQGLHLVYSQFRSMEGIGIFSLVLEANGFAKFKIKRSGSDGWELNMSEEDMGKPCYALYTGTEDAEEREIIRNIYNGAWNYIPNNIATQLRAKSSNNNLGEIIKVLMITSAGSEGINLRNTRYVHIMEPYWHPVRVEQVIGRARRICSHQSLPKALQTVEVFVYIMTFTQEQLDSDWAKELRVKDQSKRAPYLPQTSDEKLLEVSTIKEQLTSQLLIAVKEASIDCATHIKSSTKEGLVCLSFGQPTANTFSYNPNISQDQNDTIANINRTTIDWEARPFTYKPTGKRYMLRMDTKQVYDYDSVIQAKQIPGVRPILIGKLMKLSSGEYEIVKEKV